MERLDGSIGIREGSCRAVKSCSAGENRNVEYKDVPSLDEHMSREIEFSEVKLDVSEHPSMQERLGPPG